MIGENFEHNTNKKALRLCNICFCKTNYLIFGISFFSSSRYLCFLINFKILKFKHIL